VNKDLLSWGPGRVGTDRAVHLDQTTGGPETGRKASPPWVTTDTPICGMVPGRRKQDAVGGRTAGDVPAGSTPHSLAVVPVGQSAGSGSGAYLHKHRSSLKRTTVGPDGPGRNPDPSGMDTGQVTWIGDHGGSARDGSWRTECRTRLEVEGDGRSHRDLAPASRP